MTSFSPQSPDQAHRQSGGCQQQAVRRFSRAILATVATALMLACSTPPQLRLHSLLSSDASFAGQAAAADWGDPIRLIIVPIRVPAALDQPQWLVRRGDDSLQMLEQDRWAAPLSDEFRAALRARLGSRWGMTDGSVVTGAHAPDQASWRLVLEILQLDARPANDVLLEARWSLLPPQTSAKSVACSLRVVEPVRGDGSLPIAEAYRNSVVHLADRIGAQLRAAQAGQGLICDKPA